MAAAATTAVPSDGAASRPPPAALSPPPPASDQNQQQLELIEELTANVGAAQERVLAEILRRNGDSEYLAARCGLGGAGATGRAAFRAKVPLVTYEDLRPYVTRVAGGDRSPVLTGSKYPISEFFLSSSTSGGEPKLIPVVEDDFDRVDLLRNLSMAVMSRHVSGLDKPSSGLYLYFVRVDTTTPGGLPARTALTSVLKRRFSNAKKENEELTGGQHASAPAPAAAAAAAAIVLCEDAFQSMYAQLLCGLCRRLAVVRVGATFAYGVVRAVRFLQRHWRDLAADIETGTLTHRVTDASVREAVAVAGVLRRPDPELAALVRAECGGHGDDGWSGIVARLWPNARLLETVVTGAMAQYVPTLRYFAGGDLPVASTKYMASECPIGLNLDPFCDPSQVSYTIMPNMAYFEFLPTGAAATASSLVELAGVEVGREYELVVTTYGGLYRYRVGDVLRATGFHNAAPKFRFVGRRNVLLSIDADKTDEAELHRAVERASALLGAAAVVADYTSRVCAASVPPHYVVYWELRRRQGSEDNNDDDGDGGDGSGGGVVDLKRCCLEMEEGLGYVYRVLRAKDGGEIGPLEIRVVRPGTFEELANFAVDHGGASVAQFKVPRSVTDPAAVRLLDARVVSRHFSPASPHWELPGRHSFELDREKKKSRGSS